MKKVLVYLYKSQLAPVGGPYGYNYNLLRPLKELGETSISFIETTKGDARKINSVVSSIKIGWLKKFVEIVKSVVRKSRLFYGSSHYSVVDLNQYDVVHFHTVASMYECRDSLKDYKGIVLLTTHAPNRPSTSYFEMLSPFEQKYMRWFYKRVFDMDVYAFNRADYIIFPCPEAEEPYYNNWNEYAEIKKKCAAKYRYMLTGIEGCSPKVDRSSIRKQLGIPNDAFVISYVGRHNKIKGYDFLKDLGSDVLQNPNTYFLIAGRESPMEGLKHERWIEVGWTNDPHSYIMASDCFVLPNKETYFDLVMLELLSLGAIVVARNTGGNKYFKDGKTEGVLLFDSHEDAKKILAKIQNMSQEEKAVLQKSNKDLFDKYFTSDVFAKSYLELLRTI